jgi:hypothetical protein
MPAINQQVAGMARSYRKLDIHFTLDAWFDLR